MKKAFLFLFVFSFGAVLLAQQKFALVIGNGNYSGISTLKNPVNDANDMEAALKSLGFTDVIKVLNGNLEQMENAVLNLSRRLSASANSYGFFFYAGHGVQSNGENYLIPVEASNILNESHLRTRAVPLEFVMTELNRAGNEFNMVVLDACRDNPFGWNRSGTRGLSVVSRAPSGSMVFYATATGAVANDGDGRNGLFTSQLLNNLKTPGLSVRDVFERTGADVVTASGGRQKPELADSYFRASSVYLGSWPVQPVTNNMIRIQGGTFTMGSPSSEWGRDDDEVQHRVTVSSFYMGKYPVTQKEYQELMGSNPSYFKGDNFPVQMVSWYDAVDYCNRLSKKEGLTPAYTISGENVTWNYNANGYRLPTEAEWEYACRAGTTTPFSTGTNITTSQAKYDSEDIITVGSYQPNPWGLYDMHGNGSEWCWDWYGDYSNSAQTDPKGPSSGSERVARGGGWHGETWRLRSARRGYSPPSESFIFGFRVARNG